MEKIIHTTSDYSLFKKLPGNRDMKCVAKIVKSIKEVGYILCPILVNEKMEIIDGQNRLEALMELGMPVDYMVQPGLGIRECRNMNIGRGNWTTDDYIKSFAQDGNENYQRLMLLLAEFRHSMSVEGVVFMTSPHLIPNQGGVTYKVIKEGKYELSEDDYTLAKARLCSAKELGYVAFKQENEMLGRTFWGAVAYAYAHNEVSVKELISRLQENPKAIVPCGRITDQLMYFDDAYNKRKSPKNKVFMSTDFQQGKYLAGRGNR